MMNNEAISSQLASSIITREHIGRRIVYNCGRQLKEGTVEELSPSGQAFSVDGRWMRNEVGVLVEFLPERQKERPTRVDPLRRP